MKRVRYTMQEAAEILSVSVKTLERRIESGKLIGAYKDGRRRFIPQKSLIDYIKKVEKESGVFG